MGEPVPPEAQSDRRTASRYAVELDVDCNVEGTYLFASITDISSCGIFVRTAEPLPQGTQLQLRFGPTPGDARGRIELRGEVVWTTLEPGRSGMGVRFLHASPVDQRRLLELVRAIAYVDETAGN